MSALSQTQLFLDCSGPGIKIGLLRERSWLAYQQAKGSALEVLFDEVKDLLEQEKLDWSELSGVLFCEGPGSLLSLRIGAMAVQSWYQTTAFSDLPKVFPLMAAAGRLLAREQPDFLLVAPGRKGEWHCIEFKHRQPIEEARLIETNEIPVYPEIPAYWIPHRELGMDLPDRFQRWEPDWSLVPDLWTASLLQERSPDQLLSQAHVSTYARWSGAIHQK